MKSVGGVASTIISIILMIVLGFWTWACIVLKEYFKDIRYMFPDEKEEIEDENKEEIEDTEVH